MKKDLPETRLFKLIFAVAFAAVFVPYLVGLLK